MLIQISFFVIKENVHFGKSEIMYVGQIWTIFVC